MQITELVPLAPCTLAVACEGKPEPLTLQLQGGQTSRAAADHNQDVDLFPGKGKFKGGVCLEIKILSFTKFVVIFLLESIRNHV